MLPLLRTAAALLAGLALVMLAAWAVTLWTVPGAGLHIPV